MKKINKRSKVIHNTKEYLLIDTNFAYAFKNDFDLLHNLVDNMAEYLEDKCQKTVILDIIEMIFTNLIKKN